MNHPPPIINQSKPLSAREEHYRREKPSQTAWGALLRRIWQTTNVRYAFLWFAGGLCFALVGKGVLQRREEQLMVEELDQFVRNKKKE